MPHSVFNQKKAFIQAWQKTQACSTRVNKFALSVGRTDYPAVSCPVCSCSSFSPWRPSIVWHPVRILLFSISKILLGGFRLKYQGRVTLSGYWSLMHSSVSTFQYNIKQPSWKTCDHKSSASGQKKTSVVATKTLLTFLGLHVWCLPLLSYMLMFSLTCRANQ